MNTLDYSLFDACNAMHVLHDIAGLVVNYGISNTIVLEIP